MEIKDIENKLWDLSAEDLSYLYTEFLGKDYLIGEIIDNLKESEENTEVLLSILETMKENKQMNNNNIENKNEIIEKLTNIEQRAIYKYLDGVDFSDILIDRLDDDELAEYNELYIKFYGSCFNCGDNLSCRYCEEIVKGEQTNE